MASWDTGTAYTTGQPLRTGTPFSTAGVTYSGAIGNWSGGGLPTQRTYADQIATLPTITSRGRGLHQASEPRQTVSQALAEAPSADPDLSKYLVGAAAKRSNSVSGFKEGFTDALGRFIADAPGPIYINSGYRDQALQNRLFQNAVRKYGSEAAARKWVARNSNHTQGIAADLKYSSPEVQKWAHENAARYGLNFRLGHEPWHVEYAGGTRAPDAGSVPGPQPRGQGSKERMMAYAARDIANGGGGETYTNLFGRAPFPKSAATAYAPQPDAAPFEAVMGGAGTNRVVGGNVPDPRMRPDRPAPVSEALAGDYTVQSGDNLWTIAEQSLGDGQRWQEIAQANGIDDPRSLQVGQTLRIPGSQPQPGESMTRPEDYITGRVSGQTPDRLQAGNYRSRADQIPDPRIAPPREVAGIPNPPANPRRQGQPMSDAEFRQTVDEINALGAKYGRPPVPIRGNPNPTGLMPEAEQQQIRQEIEALKAKQAQFPQSGTWDGRDISTANSPFAAGINSYDPEIERAMIDRMRQLDAQGVSYDQATQIAINEARAAQMGQPVFVSRDGVRIFAAR